MGSGGCLTLLMLCIAAHSHAAIQLYILIRNTHCFVQYKFIFPTYVQISPIHITIKMC